VRKNSSGKNTRSTYKEQKAIKKEKVVEGKRQAYGKGRRKDTST